MPAFKDEARGTWFASFYYQDWTGKRRQKKKRGFARKKDALEWEREFLKTTNGVVDMTFAAFAELYLDDLAKRVRESTRYAKHNLVVNQILPFFGSMLLGNIKPIHIRKWQNEITVRGYSSAYIRAINKQLSAMFNHAVMFYQLAENPMKRVGAIAAGSVKEMSFWTLDEYTLFLQRNTLPPLHKLIIDVLYWTGMRIGEVLALTPADIDLDKRTITVNKTLYQHGKKKEIHEPKTVSSKRLISITESLSGDLEKYIMKLDGIKQNQRVFDISAAAVRASLQRQLDILGMGRIRIHDLRHSHASLLIELGYSIQLISERLGHKNAQITLSTYSHLYPHKQEELAEHLEELVPK